MYFSAVKVSGFGPIASFQASLPHFGVSLVVGENATGKTSLVSALLTALCGCHVAQAPGVAASALYGCRRGGVCFERSALRNGQSLAPSKIEVTLSSPGHSPTTILVNGSSDVTLPVVRHATGNLDDLLLDQLHPGGRHPPRLTIREDRITEPDLVPVEDRIATLALLDQVAPGLNVSQRLFQPEGYLSTGARSLYELARECRSREAPGRTQPPLVIDDLLAGFDQECRQVAVQVLARLSTRCQVILFVTPGLAHAVVTALSRIAPAIAPATRVALSAQSRDNSTSVTRIGPTY